MFSKLRLGAIVAVLATMCSIPLTAMAATLRVERDGTGDYSTIQPALNAAASGDTVLIGPGSYTEYTTVQPAGWSWAVESFGYSELPYLTIIGAGVDQTIIGPDVPMRDASRASAICLLRVHQSELVLVGVTVRNCYTGLFADGGRLDIEGCRFLDCAEGTQWHPNGSGGRFTNSTFSSVVAFAEAVLLHGPGGSVDLEDVTSTAGGRFYFSSVDNVLVDRCDLSGGVSGLDSVFGTSLTVRNSHLYGAENQQVYIYGGSCTIENSVLEGGVAAVVSSTASTLLVSGSVLSGSFAAVSASGAEVMTIHGSHILQGAQWAVWADGAIPAGRVTYDLTNNYWGTGSASDIDAWIWDSHDSSENWGTVDYLPFSAQEVPTESRSWGDLKALFR